MIVPLQYLGEGQFQAPKGFAKRCDDALVIGDVQRWEIAHERNAASHAHYFAVVAEAWENLPEDMAADFPSPDHLRKWALIRSGFCNISKVIAGEDPKPMLLDSYAIVVSENGVTTIYTAKSQSVRSMGKAEFQKSKEAVLAEIGKIIGADPSELGKAA